jgi:hypothetical protein
MRETDCTRFLDRLDRAEAGVSEDPHPTGCASCRAAREASTAMRLAMARRSAVPSDFAARVATLAWLDARDRRAAPRRIHWDAMAVPVAVSAVGVGIAFAIPIIQENLGGSFLQAIETIGSLRTEAFHLAGIALVGTALIALAAARVTRART